MTRPDRPLLSIVAPCLDEEASIGPFMAEMRAMHARDLPDCRLEYVFVDDGSTDSTPAILAELAATDPSVTAIRLSRRFGKEAALTAGLDFAAGDAVIPIDVDLQDPPEVIPALVSRWREGYDMVAAVRESRARDALVKRASARLFYAVFNRMSDVHIPADAGDFRLMDRRVVDALKRLPERNRFMKGLYAWVGFSATSVFFTRAPRRTGASKFNLPRLWNFALDGIVSFSAMPLKVWTYVGLAVAGVALAFAAWILFHALVFGVRVQGLTLFMIVMLTAAGLQMISVGVLGEYLGRLFLEAKGRPIYLIDRVERSPDPAGRDRYAPPASAADVHSS